MNDEGRAIKECILRDTIYIFVRLLHLETFGSSSELFYSYEARTEVSGRF